MPSDPKQCGKRKKKRRFQGNQHKKLKSVPDEVENERDVTDETGNEESVHVETTDDSQPSTSGIKTLPSATPTRSEIKILNKYNKHEESSSDSISSDSDSDEGNSEDESLNEELEGNRIIDVAILNQNISTHLLCRATLKTPMKVSIT